MMRISLLMTALRSFFLVAALAAYQPAVGQQIVTFDIQTTLLGDTVYAHFRAAGFTNILSMQFTMEWDESQMEYVGVNDFNLPNLGAVNFGTQGSASGTLTHSWNDPSLNGVTKTQCSSLFTLKFLTLNGQTSPVTITTSPTADEIIDSNNNPVAWEQSSLACSNIGNIHGNVFRDIDNNCDQNTGDAGLPYWKIKIEDGANTYYQSTNSEGNYLLTLLPGQYTVSVVIPNEDLWESCTPVQTITVDSAASVTVDFPVDALLDCPLLSVDLSTPFLRRCFPNIYYVKYQNEGTITAEDAYVNIEFDPFLTVIGSSIPWSAVNGQTYTFDLGDVPPMVDGNFYVQVEVGCDAVLGQTHCTSAHIFPDDPCVPLLLWDGSNLQVTGNCDGDSVRFDIINAGDDMTQPVEFIVIEDDMVYLAATPIQLQSQETTALAFQANGSTWRVEMPQAPANPNGTFTAGVVEGCGTNGSGNVSLGFVTQFPLPEEPLSIDVDCQANIGAYDPNDKIGYPTGFCQAHYIRTGQDIEYKIRFQNTGTDTAFNIYIIDTLSQFLSPASVRPGSSSHPYEFELLGGGVVKFAFPNIMLPDSNTNEPASHGFVKFTIAQQPNLAMATVIENSAAIYFDFNDPVITNTYRHTIGDDFVEMQGQVGDLSVSGTVRTWFGQPVEDVEMTMTNLCPVLTDENGYFLFENVDTANYALTAFKPGEIFTKILTVLDIAKMRGIILGLNTGNEYQLWAADLNGSNSVTTFDLVVYTRMILGVETPSLAGKWLFLRADFDPSNPGTSQADRYIYEPLSADLDNQDFVAIQRGNVLDESMVPQSPINTQFYLEKAGQSNGQMRVHVKAMDFTDVNGFQFSLKWDPSVFQFAGQEGGALNTLPSQWFYSPVPGVLNLVYLNNPSITLTADQVLFTLVFDIVGNVGATSTFELDESNIPLQVVVSGCELASGSLTGTTVTVEEPTAVIDWKNSGLQVKIAPNPVQQGRPVLLEVASFTDRSLDAQLFDLNGKMLVAKTLLCPAGSSSHTLSHPLPKGIYFLKITGENTPTATAKLMVY